MTAVVNLENIRFVQGIIGLMPLPLSPNFIVRKLHLEIVLLKMLSK